MKNSDDFEYTENQGVVKKDTKGTYGVQMTKFTFLFMKENISKILSPFAACRGSSKIHFGCSLTLMVSHR